MPLLTIDVLKGRSNDELKLLLDTIHSAVVDAFQVPERDRYQIVNQHEPNEMVIQDTGLGFNRSNEVVVIRMVSKRRTSEQKEMFYALTQDRLEHHLKLAPKDLMISIVENDNADWSFGFGRAQFVTGEL
ncbi:tautomerase family protein [Listeria fleischmannii]|uniref:tautomerase family protein n=1 Tax=Listeria fleischmannii TaxID=1069827 RepID=UPI0016261695|nr:tautomerase family protein [Listeria fleischmannii]MBC1419618.1 tautomerase family protein [Listeria fleischmannii]